MKELGGIIGFLIFLAIAYAMARWLGPSPDPNHAQAGFWKGILHGLIMPMNLLALWLDSKFTLFAASHTGRAYQTGFGLGVMFSALASVTPSTRRRRYTE